MRNLDKDPLWKRWGYRALRVGLAAAWEFQQRLLDARAAGLVFTTLLSLVPFLAVVVAVLKTFGVDDHLEAVLDQLVAPLGPNGQLVTGAVVQFVNNFDVGVLGTIGVVGLLYTTYSLVEKMEDTFNAIWRVRRGRSWGQRIVEYFTIVLVGPLAMVSALGLLTSLHNQAVVQRILEIPPLGVLAVRGAEYLPFVLLAAVFGALYKFLPHARVSTMAALVGGGAAAVLWGAAGQGFAFFVARSTSYSAMYAGSAIVVLSLLWLYLGWLIILLGAQVAYFYQHPNTYEWQYLGTHGVQAWRERAGLCILQALARRCMSGEGDTPLDAIAQETNVTLPTIEEMIEVFAEAGYVSKERGHTAHCRLLRAPAAISLAEVIRVIHYGGLFGGGPGPSGSDGLDHILRRRDEAVVRALEGLTLEALAIGESSLPGPAVNRVSESDPSGVG